MLLVLAPGALIEFYQDKKILCGLCLKADKKSSPTLHLLSEENRELSIPAQRVLLGSGGFMNPTALREDVVARLKSTASQREALKSSVAIADLWELLCDEPGQYKVEELAATWFGGTLEDEQISAMLRALYDDRIYFERKADLYIAHPRERVKQLLDSIQAEQNKLRERDEMCAWMQGVWARRNLPGALTLEKPACLPKYLEWLKDVVLYDKESSRFKEIQAVLVKAGIQQRDAAFQILVRAGVWKPDENLALHRNHVPIEFPRDVLAEADEDARKLHQGTWRTEARVDLTDLHAVTIDDEHTVETDDAVSIRRLENGWEVGIHIADPAEFVVPGSALDREALHRGTSVYFPDQKIPMLPPIIGTEVCSLTANEERPALSVIAVLDDEANLIESRIVESTVCIRQRLTYDYVDARLQDGSDENITTLHRLAHLRRLARLASGAVFIPFPAVEVHVEMNDDGTPDIEVKREEHDIPSHVLVSEFMILANEAAARYCVEHQIPAVYRGQPPPSEPIVIGDTFTALDGFKIRRLLRKGETSLDPIRHSGLGVDAYMQFTSPIRRYLDLVMHRQIKRHLREGQPMYTRDELEKISTITGSSSEQAESMERARKAYWIYRHLESCLWQERRATVLQTFPDRYHVQLYDTLVEADCPGVPGVPVSPGEIIDVKIELVWPRESVLRLSALLSKSAAV